MIFGIQTNIYATTVVLLTALAVSSNAASIYRRDDIQQSKFFDQPINTPDAFKQSTLTINKVLESKHGISYAEGTYQDKPIRIACGNDNDNADDHELLVLKDLRKATAISRASEPGYNYLAYPIHDFNINENKCYITSARCDHKLSDQNEKKLSPSILSNTKLPMLGTQYLEALYALRRIGWSYGDAEPEDFCVNADENEGLQLVVRNFEKADYLKISGTQGVSVKRFVELVNWHTIYLIMLTNSFINDWLFSVGGLIKSRYIVTEIMNEKYYGHI
ncbi:hypothetical protein BDF19DRAFT_497746 [Syncephalis fuscata]|nr:hypothetical protein BDF19DRAFT_497746 [Syncephalis fuscata]